MRLGLGMTVVIGAAGMIGGCGKALDASAPAPIAPQANHGSEETSADRAAPERTAASARPLPKSTKGPCRDEDGRIRLGCLPAGTVQPREAAPTPGTKPPPR